MGGAWAVASCVPAIACSSGQLDCWSTRGPTGRDGQITAPHPPGRVASQMLSRSASAVVEVEHGRGGLELLFAAGRDDGGADREEFDQVAAPAVALLL